MVCIEQEMGVHRSIAGSKGRLDGIDGRLLELIQLQVRADGPTQVLREVLHHIRAAMPVEDAEDGPHVVGAHREIDDDAVLVLAHGPHHVREPVVEAAPGGVRVHVLGDDLLQRQPAVDQGDVGELVRQRLDVGLLGAQRGVHGGVVTLVRGGGGHEGLEKRAGEGGGGGGVGEVQALEARGQRGVLLGGHDDAEMVEGRESGEVGEGDERVLVEGELVEEREGGGEVGGEVGEQVARGADGLEVLELAEGGGDLGDHVAGEVVLL